MKLKILCATTIALGLFGCQSADNVKVLDAHYISPAHATDSDVVEVAKSSTLDKKASEKYRATTALPPTSVYYTVNKGYLRDEVEKLRARIGLSKVVWHSSIPSCLDWPIHVNYRLDVKSTGDALEDFFSGYPLTPKWFQGDGVLEILPAKPLYQYGECADV